MVAGFTINEQTWLPSFPPPYVIAIVAIEEDDRVRLTTNIVGCEPGDVFVGMKVQVRFEHDEDVWIPLFEPTGETEKGPFPAADPTIHDRPPDAEGARRSSRTRSRSPASACRRSAAGSWSTRSRSTVEAAEQAIADAGLEPSTTSTASPPTPVARLGGGMSEGGITALEEALRLRPLVDQRRASRSPGQGGAVIAAMLAVAGGLCKHVLCFRTVWEATYAAKQRRR